MYWQASAAYSAYYKTLFMSNHKVQIDSNLRVFTVEKKQRSLVGYYALFIPVGLSVIGSFYSICGYINGSLPISFFEVILGTFIGAFNLGALSLKWLFITDGEEGACWLNRTSYMEKICSGGKNKHRKQDNFVKLILHGSIPSSYDAFYFFELIFENVFEYFRAQKHWSTISSH